MTLGIPAHKLQTVLELVHSRKRHYALNVIVHHWGRTTTRSHPIPKDAVPVKDVRSIKRFCCHCDADNHKYGSVRLAMLPPPSLQHVQTCKASHAP